MLKKWRDMMRRFLKAGIVDAAYQPWEDAFEFSKADERNSDWLEEFLDGAPNLREAHEKGTASFSIDKAGNIRGHFTPDYYLDLIEMEKGRDLRDPWGNGPSMFIEDMTPGYNFSEDRNHPDNRAWAVQQCKAHEANLKSCPPLPATSRVAGFVLAT